MQRLRATCVSGKAVYRVYTCDYLYIPVYTCVREPVYEPTTLSLVNIPAWTASEQTWHTTPCSPVTHPPQPPHDWLRCESRGTWRRGHVINLRDLQYNGRRSYRTMSAFLESDTKLTGAHNTTRADIIVKLSIQGWKTSSWIVSPGIWPSLRRSFQSTQRTMAKNGRPLIPWSIPWAQWLSMDEWNETIIPHIV